MSRVRRQLLTGWVAHPRPKGSPLMTLGRTVKKALIQCGQAPEFLVWSKVAADRTKWRKICGQMTPTPRPKPTVYAEQVREVFYGPPPLPGCRAAAPPATIAPNAALPPLPFYLPPPSAPPPSSSLRRPPCPPSDAARE